MDVTLPRRTRTFPSKLLPLPIRLPGKSCHAAPLLYGMVLPCRYLPCCWLPVNFTAITRLLAPVRPRVYTMTCTTLAVQRAAGSGCRLPPSWVVQYHERLWRLWFAFSHRFYRTAQFPSQFWILIGFWFLHTQRLWTTWDLGFTLLVTVQQVACPSGAPARDKHAVLSTLPFLNAHGCDVFQHTAYWMDAVVTTRAGAGLLTPAPALHGIRGTVCLLCRGDTLARRCGA